LFIKAAVIRQLFLFTLLNILADFWYLSINSHEMNNPPDVRRAEKRFFLARKITYVLLSIILFIYALIQVRNFLYPIAFGFVLSYLLYPIASRLEKKGFPRILANLVTIFGGLILLGGILTLAYVTISPMAGDLPNLLKTGAENFSDIVARAGSIFGFNDGETREMVQNQASSAIESGSAFFQNFFTATTNTIVAIGLMPVYIFLFLYYRTKFMYFLLKAAGRSSRRLVIVILREISTVTVRYMAGILLVVFSLCIINSLGLYIIGVKYAIALGVASALFNLIPYFGTLIGGLVPFLFAIMVQGDITLALKVVVLFIIIQFIENNILTPNIVGGKVKINPFFIITGLVAASMIWGIPGMLLIVPFLAITRIVFSHIDFMRPYSFLLGEEGTSKHSIQMSKVKRFFSGAWSRISPGKAKENE
jgi:predicted PurR-regulated permease PerM